MIKPVTLPEIGENVESGVVVAVPVKTGDKVTVDDTVIELETDKALVEIPSPIQGRIVQVLVEPGMVVKVGDVIVRIETDGQISGKKRETAGPGLGATPAVSFFSDMKSNVLQAFSHLQPDENKTILKSPVLPDFNRWGKIEKREMSTVRRLTAEKTSTSWTTIPHVTQFDESDITDLMTFNEKQHRQNNRSETRPTLTAIITRICAQALKRFQRFNASIDPVSNHIIYKRYINIGIATDTPRGLLVPVIRNANDKKIGELTKEIADLSNRARNKKIKPDELEGGPFSISNQGKFGGTGFTPVINWPQVAVLGVSRAVVKPVFKNDGFEPRTVLPLSLSYDHRIIDGADAAQFLHWICNELQKPTSIFFGQGLCITQKSE